MSYVSPNVERMIDNSALDTKTKKSEEKREKIIQTANKEIEDFYAGRREAIEKAKKQRRQEEVEYVQTRESLEKSDNPWAVVATLVNFKGAIGTKDTQRIKKVLIDLKQ